MMPKQYRTFNGKVYKLKHRFETEEKAKDSAKYQKLIHSSRIDYSIKVVKLPKNQYGMVYWDINPYATYEYMGYLAPEIETSLSEMFI